MLFLWTCEVYIDSIKMVPRVTLVSFVLGTSIIVFTMNNIKKKKKKPMTKSKYYRIYNLTS